MNRSLLIIIITLTFPLFSCGGQSTISSLTPTIDTKATIKAAVNATLTAQPTDTPTPRSTATKTPRVVPRASSTSDLSAFSLFFCIISLLFFFLTLLYVKLYLNRSKELKIFKENFETAKNDSDSQIQKLKDTIEKQSKDNLFSLRKKWLKDISEVSFHNEVEVEVKFIHPLVEFLGYKEDEFELRVPVNIQLGHNSMKGEADWVLWDVDDNLRFPRFCRHIVKPK